jgi:hypothetical protein
VREFIDGSTTGTQSLSFYARSKTPGTAIDTLNDIKAELDQPEITLSETLCIRVLPNSNVSFVSKEDTGESVYTFSADIDYDSQNGKGV